jgi:hypothetical protein
MSFWQKSGGPVIRGRIRPLYLLLFIAVVCVLLAPTGFVSKTMYRQLGSWLQQHLCMSAFGGYSVTGLILASAVSAPLLVLIVAGGFWIRHGVRMVREKTNDLPGHKPLFDTALVEGSSAVRGGRMEVAAGVFLMLACSFVLLGPVLGMDVDLFLRHPSEMAACKAAA